MFCGYDSRESIGFHVFVASVIGRASVPVAFYPLGATGLQNGSNAFTFSRFLVPHLMGFKGHAIFCDASDMLMLDDIAELDALFDPAYAVQVVQHPNYSTRHKIKYRGTSMECPNRDYARKNWASVMIMNCEHPYWGPFDVETLSNAGVPFLQFGGLRNEEIGALPDKWNRLVDEGQPIEGASLLHWTAGIPAFEMYKNAPGADLWSASCDVMLEV
jgi:hypothetical protein